jgi:hypothetical protein
MQPGQIHLRPIRRRKVQLNGLRPLIYRACQWHDDEAKPYYRVKQVLVWHLERNCIIQQK